MTSIAVYRPTTGEWFIPDAPARFPSSGSRRCPGSGRLRRHRPHQLAVYRPSTGQFFIAGHANPIQVGAPGQIPVPGAYDNSLTSRKVEPAVYNPATGIMTIMGPNNQLRTVQFTPGSIPVPGDYDSVGSDQPAAFNPTTNTWTIYATGSNQPRTTTFGGPKGEGWPSPRQQLSKDPCGRRLPGHRQGPASPCSAARPRRLNGSSLEWLVPRSGQGTPISRSWAISTGMAGPIWPSIDRARPSGWCRGSSLPMAFSSVSPTSIFPPRPTTTGTEPPPWPLSGRRPVSGSIARRRDADQAGTAGDTPVPAD